jgi:hypothetical protein
MRRIPTNADEDLLREAGTLFAFGSCRLCGAHFRPQIRDDHLGYHRALHPEYVRERNLLDRLRLEQEKRLGAMLTCQAVGLQPVREKALGRHEQRSGREHVDELIPYLHMSGTSQSAPAIHGGMRSVRGASRENDALPWRTLRTRKLGLRILALERRGLGAMAIADKLGKSDAVVRRYLREADGYATSGKLASMERVVEA